MRAWAGAVLMGFQVVETGPTERRLEIEVPAERVGEEFERIFRSMLGTRGPHLIEAVI